MNNPTIQMRCQAGDAAHASGALDDATSGAAQIGAAQARGDADLGDTYYRHWLAALETIVAGKGATTATELAIVIWSASRISSMFPSITDCSW